MSAKQNRENVQPRFEFRWENFRSFEDSGWIKIRPITIFIGANNSGKTSLIRPLLLMKQTMESRDPRLVLKLSGPLTNLGNYYDLVFRHRIDQSIRLHLKYLYPQQHRATKSKRFDVPPGEISIHLQRGSSETDIKLRQTEIRDVHGRDLLTWTESGNGRYRIKFPLGLSGKMGKLIKESKPIHFLFPDTELMRNLVQSTKGNKLVLQGGAAIYIGTMSWTRTRVRSLLSNLDYVGPLPDKSDRIYAKIAYNSRCRTLVSHDDCAFSHQTKQRLRGALHVRVLYADEANEEL